MCIDPEPSIQTTADLRRSGRTRSDITAAVRADELARIRHGVYAAGLCDDAKDAVAHGGRLGCVSAARHMGLWVLDEADDGDALHVAMAPHGHLRHEGGCQCVVHWDAAGPAGSALAPVALVLRQILRCRGVAAFFVALESARRKRLIDDDGLRWLRENTNAQGRDAVDFSSGDADSGIESLFRWRLRDLTALIRCQVRITGVGVVDFLIGDRLIVEIDGRANHQGQDKRHKDLRRDAGGATWGYITLRFDYAMVVHDWETVEMAVRGMIDAGMHLR